MSGSMGDAEPRPINSMAVEMLQQPSTKAEPFQLCPVGEKEPASCAVRVRSRLHTCKVILSALDRAREAGELTVNQNGKAEQEGEGAKFLYILSAS